MGIWICRIYKDGGVIMLYKDYVERKTANAIRINSAEGYPCEFDNSKGRPLKDYKLYGKSIQDGTPSIENPIEVQSVGDLITDETSEYYGKYDIPIVVNDTTTHIYLDEPLRKVGSYADYIDFKNQKVVRNIIKRSLDIESIYRKLNNVIRFTAPGPFGKCDYHIRSTIFGNYSGFSNDKETVFHHPTSMYAFYWSVYWHRLGLTYDGTNVYRTDDTEQTPLTNSEIINIANKWLNTLSNKDREVYIILDTPTKKSTTLTALKTFKGTNIISVDTNISPSNIQVQYIER